MPRLLLIGWDGADWGVIQPLLDAGRMPHLQRLVERGVMGNLASLHPCLTPILWTSIATGCTADAHGVLGFVEPRADGLGVTPYGRSAWRRKAVWNLLAERGLRCSVVGWPVSHPADAGVGVFVSDRFPEAGSVHPAELAETAGELRLDPRELTPPDIRFLLRDVEGIDPRVDGRPWQLAELFAACATVHSVGTWVAEAEPWDFLAVYYEAIDRVGHDFMQYRAPRMAHVSEADGVRYGNVVDAFYEFHDAMLGRWMELAGEDCHILLVSDHGFQTGAGRPVQASHQGAVVAEGADWHRMLGVLVLAGPGVKRDERVYGASLLDLAPTVLHLMGQPVRRDLPGRVLTGVFENPGAVSWTEGDAGVAPVTVGGAEDWESRAAAVRRLVDLGYLAADALGEMEGAQLAEREQLFNLATVHLHHGRQGEALALYERLCGMAPLTARYEMARLGALSAMERHEDVVHKVQRLEELGYGHRQMELMAGMALAGLGRHGEAESRYRKAVEMDGGNARVHQVVGDYRASRGDLDGAVASYLRAVELDPEHAGAHSGLAEAYLDRGEYALAAESALTSLQQAFWNPVGQFRLGRALAALGYQEQAKQAFLHAVEQAPGYGEAHLRLAELYLDEGDGLRAAQHRERALARP